MEAVFTGHLEGLATFSRITMQVLGLSVGQADVSQCQGDDQDQEGHPEGLPNSPFSVYPLFCKQLRLELNRLSTLSTLQLMVVR